MGVNFYAWLNIPDLKVKCLKQRLVLNTLFMIS